MKRILFLVIIFLFVSLSVYSQRSKSVAPENKIKNYVTDKTGTLSPDQLASLESKLSNFDKQTSTQIVVYIIPSLEGGSLEEKSIDIATQNGVGKKGNNNGALLFIAKDDRKLRIEVGYGLEGALTDALCDQIIRKEITPQFKLGKYYEGINAGVDAIISTTKGEYTQDTKTTKESTDPGLGGLICGLPIIFVIFLFFIGFIIISRIISRIFGWRHLGGGGGWFMGGGSGWSGGSSGGSWGGGGGFSGGGGDFGGGGASGSW